MQPNIELTFQMVKQKLGLRRALDFFPEEAKNLNIETATLDELIDAYAVIDQIKFRNDVREHIAYDQFMHTNKHRMEELVQAIAKITDGLVFKRIFYAARPYDHNEEALLATLIEMMALFSHNALPLNKSDLDSTGGSEEKNNGLRFQAWLNLYLDLRSDKEICRMIGVSAVREAMDLLKRNVIKTAERCKRFWLLIYLKESLLKRIDKRERRDSFRDPNAMNDLKFLLEEILGGDNEQETWEIFYCEIRDNLIDADDRYYTREILEFAFAKIVEFATKHEEVAKLMDFLAPDNPPYAKNINREARTIFRSRSKREEEMVMSALKTLCA